MNLSKLDDRVYIPQIARTLNVRETTLHVWKSRGRYPSLGLRAGRNRLVFTSKEELLAFAREWYAVESDAELEAAIAAGNRLVRKDTTEAAS